MTVSKAILCFLLIVAVFAGVKWAMENNVLGEITDRVPSVDFVP